MTREEIAEYIENLDANKLVELCEDINEWKYKNGEMKPNCALKKLSIDTGFRKMRELEEMILEAAHEKFHDLVLLLMKTAAWRYME